MKIKFDTTSGVDTKRWECLLAVSCTPDSETPDELLEAGWLLDPITNDWYMSRSVRIDLSRWSPSDSASRCCDSYDWKEIRSLSDSDKEMLQAYRRERGIIDYPYDAFWKNGRVKLEKGFSDSETCWYMTVHFENSSLYPICAFLKSGSRTSPGKACWTRACQVSKDAGSKYLYVYEGYGLGSTYKSNFEGFEWWDGARWSDDQRLYLECLKDDGRV